MSDCLANGMTRMYWNERNGFEVVFRVANAMTPRTVTVISA